MIFGSQWRDCNSIKKLAKKYLSMFQRNEMKTEGTKITEA